MTGEALCGEVTRGKDGVGMWGKMHMSNASMHMSNVSGLMMIDV